jgi:phosphomannomutase
MNNVVLFDMDGTLTPARKSIEQDMEEALMALSRVAKVGIVTGSTFEYVMQQCGSLFKSNKDFSNFLILPCNGTQKYSWDRNEWESGLWQKDFSLDMREHLGEKKYRVLVSALIERLYILSLSHQYKIPTTGNFISYRDSLVNFCPIGRSANNQDREEFKKYDKEHNVRLEVLKKLKNSELSKDLAFSLGGNTSIDIYPHGWDKTYALNYYEGHNHWFIGDRCTVETGNDKPIYDKVRENTPNQAFEVKNPQETIKIIDSIIQSLL